MELQIHCAVDAHFRSTVDGGGIDEGVLLFIFPFLDNNDVVVTKPVLRTAAENCALIRLTLSLPPFQFETFDFHTKKRKWF